uniref:Vasculin n=1 Tax=Geotrypetes seraphini TaxID=260995 RepID=A0A6P8QHB8_GEOSA|nr:vasculin isoform X2 [Geotrypetes seraphini]
MPSAAVLSFSLHFEKLSENRFDIGRRRHNFSDGFDSSIGHSNGGNFGRKQRNGWRSQARNGTENINHRGSCSRTHCSTFHSGKSQELYENDVPDNETGKKVVGEGPKQFEAEDFPSLNPAHEKGLNQKKSLAGGVWEYPLNPRSRSSRMLVIKKGIRDLTFSGFHVVTTSHSLPVKSGTSPYVYKGLVPKPVVPTIKCNRSNSLSPVDKLSQPRLTKLTRVRTDKKNEFLKALKQDRVEEELEDGNQAEQEKDTDRYDLHNGNIHHERDINRNFDENEISQENGNDLVSQQPIRSSAFSQAGTLSSSLEAEHRLLKEMGWQEYSENDETCAPLTEDEMREFQEISEQLQKNSLRKNGLNVEFKFGFLKNSTFKSTIEIDDTETSSSDTSDDDV